MATALDFEAFEQIRNVLLGNTGYRVELFDTLNSDRGDQTEFAYRVFEPGNDSPIIRGRQFWSPVFRSYSDDSDQTIRSLLTFLTYDGELPDELAPFSFGEADRLDPETGLDCYPLIDVD